jgi:hypothetical protein
MFKFLRILAGNFHINVKDNYDAELVESFRIFLKERLDLVLASIWSVDEMWTIYPTRTAFSYHRPILSITNQQAPRLTDVTTKKPSVVLVRKRTTPTERLPHFGEVSAKFCGQRVSRGQRSGSPRLYSRFSSPEPLLFLPSSSSIVLTRLSGPRSRPTTSQKKMVTPGIKPGISGYVARNSDH